MSIEKVIFNRKRRVEELNAQIDALEAERDAAQAEVDELEESK